MRLLSVFLIISAPVIQATPQPQTHRLVPKSVVLPNAMAPAFLKYVACLDDKTNMTIVTDAASFKATVEKGISACAPIRAGLVAEAESSLSADPKYRDPAVRARVAAAAFDTQDEIQHAMGEGRVIYESQ